MDINLINKEILDQIIELRKGNPFPGGLSVMFDKDGLLALVDKPDQYNGRETMLTTAEKFLAVATHSQELIREKRKFAKTSFSSISGLLPQSEIVSCLGAYSEGAMTNNSLINPTSEGGQIFILLLRSTILDFALNDEIITDVGVPSTILVVRTEKVVKSSSDYFSPDDILNEDNSYLQVKAMFAACVKGRGRIDANTKMYHYPFANTNKSNFGRVCLGTVFGTELLTFKSSAHLDTLAVDFISSMATTHDLGTSYKSQDVLTQRQLILQHKNRPFSENELVEMDMNYAQFIQGAVDSLYK